MADEGEVHVASESGGSAGKWILLALAVLYVAGSLYFIFDLRGRLDKMSKDQAASSTQIADLSKRMQSARGRRRNAGHAVGHDQERDGCPVRGLGAAAACVGSASWRNSRSSRSAQSAGKWLE